MTFNYSKLKGRIIEVYGSQASFAAEIDKTQTYVSMVLNNRIKLGTEQIIYWASKLGIDSSEIGYYFFWLNDSKEQTK